jgi:hypothetical protein
LKNANFFIVVGGLLLGHLTPCLAQNTGSPEAAQDPQDLVYKTSPRPWGNSFLPQSKMPAHTLLVVTNLSSLTPDERAALLSLQGLTSRSHPIIWLSSGSDPAKDFALETMMDAHSIRGYKIVADWKSLFTEYLSSYKGAVVYDPDLYRSDTLAANIAGAEDLIATSKVVADELHIPIKVDLRGRFTNYADGLQWVWDRDGTLLNHRLCLMSPNIGAPTSYAIEWGAVIFWPAGYVDAKKPGADPDREVHLTAQILSQMEPNTAMIGYPYAGDGVGIGEGDGVKLASEYGISLIASDNLDNFPVLSGVHIESLKQKPQPPLPTLERDKIYIALVMSDGDNMGSWRWMHDDFFQHPRYGTFPLAFGIGPTILDLQPSIAKWYYDRAAPNTEFISDVSGIAYMQPENYGARYKYSSDVIDGFLQWTSYYMRRADLKTLRTVEGSDQILEAYASNVHPLDSLFADMGRTDRSGIANLTYTLPNNVPVFRSVTSWRYGKDGFLREVREQVGDVRPAFVNGFVHIWTFRMNDLSKIYDGRDPDMVFVTPSQLAQLYRQSVDKGWAASSK